MPPSQSASFGLEIIQTDPLPEVGPDRGTIPSVKRRLLNALAGLSLILALATGGLWGRSYSVADYVLGQLGGQNEYGVRSDSGRFILHWAQRDIGWQWDSAPAHDYGFDWFEYGRTRGLGRMDYIVFPHWSLMIACTILPTLRGWQLLRARKRPSENLCPQCGYDLRATPQRCPECGHEMELGRKRHEGT
jgi:hypothetical protein